MSRTRYIAMAPPTTLCRTCDGRGEFGRASRRSCAACGGRGRIEVDGDLQPNPPLWSIDDVSEASPRSVLAVNLDDLERVDPPESDDEREQRLERIALAAWAELDELRRKRVAPPVEREPVAGPAVSHVRIRCEHDTKARGGRWFHFEWCAGGRWTTAITVDGSNFLERLDVPIVASIAAAKPRSGT